MKRIGTIGAVAIGVFLMGLMVGRYERPDEQQRVVLGTTDDGKIKYLCPGDCSYREIVRKLDRMQIQQIHVVDLEK